MRLKKLIKSLGNYRLRSNFLDFEVKGISCNSRSVLNGFIFVAIKGTNVDGHNFIKEAIQRGAKAVVVQAPAPKPKAEEDITIIEVKDTRGALAKLAVRFYADPSSKIKVVGVTGTNGKTSVTYLLEVILKGSGSNPGVIGTVNYRFKDRIIPSKNTTPGPLELQEMLSQMAREAIDYAIMEVSSHALHQQRTEGINFHSAIFTNLSQDHLDYHHTLKEYFQAKAKLFKDLSPTSFVVINNDDDYAKKIEKITPAKRIITYGLKGDCDISAKDIKFNLKQTEFILKTPEEKMALKTPLIGYHNIYNILAAIAWAYEEKIEPSIIKKVLKDFRGAPGRLERIDSQRDFLVFVDYAHTEDALRQVLISLRRISKEKIIVVFGCGGERDKTKRPKMGRVVTDLADYAIITNDNPRSEDPQKIIDDIKKGIKKRNYCVMPDRKAAIRRSLSLAKKADIVLIAGKGHENYQILKDKTLNFDDRKVIRECLKSMNY